LVRQAFRTSEDASTNRCILNDIVTERIVLRALRLEDAATMFSYRTDADVAQFQSSVIPNSLGAVRAFIEENAAAASLAPDTWYQLGIGMRDGGKLIGDCGIHVVDEGRQIEIGITISRPFQRQHYATEAMTALLNALFGDLGKHRVFGSIDPRNMSSNRLFERLGFRREAHMVESLWFRSEWVDDVVVAMLRREWFARRSRM
jgi:RimJ/RimL family protein N-acetyltransferase